MPNNFQDRPGTAQLFNELTALVTDHPEFEAELPVLLEDGLTIRQTYGCSEGQSGSSVWYRYEDEKYPNVYLENNSGNVLVFDPEAGSTDSRVNGDETDWGWEDSVAELPIVDLKKQLVLYHNGDLK